MPYDLDHLPSDGEARQIALLEAIALRLNVQLPLTSDGGARRGQLVDGIARRYGILPPFPTEQEPGMADVTTSIGTSSRDYSTITAWEADLDNSGVYNSGDVAIGECYNDAAFDESVVVNGGGTVGLSGITLTVAIGERHDGTAGTGARIVLTTARDAITESVGNDVLKTSLLWLEIDYNENDVVDNGFGVTFKSRGDASIQHILLHSGRPDASGLTAALDFVGDETDADVSNNIIYDWRCPKTGDGDFKAILTRAESAKVLNNTIHNITSNSSSNDVLGVSFEFNHVNAQLQNNVVTDVSLDSGSGTAVCFSSSITTGTESHNASSDTTASGTGSLTEILAADQYVSTTGGSEDLHLKTGADCIDAGTDLGTTPSGVEIDIDGRDRDANGDTWDIGADEFVAASAAAVAMPARLTQAVMQAGTW